MIPKHPHRLPAFLVVGILLALPLLSCSAFHPVPTPPAPTAVARQYAREVVINRDRWGIPHVFGKTDNAATFGLAYAHAEDDFPLIQASLVAARGQLARLHLAKISIVNDYLVQLLGIPEKAERQYRAMPPEFKKFLDAYAEGLNTYAHFHPQEADIRFFPVSGKDIVAGFIHKIPLLMGVGKVLEDLFSRPADRLGVDAAVQKRFVFNEALPAGLDGRLAGSNAHAVGPRRSADGKVRLNINSHQPWEGPVAWYEAHVVSEEGWNAIGGTFPGAPVILHGHNQYLGWAHTVNRPDFIDVYKLEMHPDGSLQYRFDDQWLPLNVKDAAIDVDLGLFEWTVHKNVYASVHGPVIELKGGYYAIRYAGAHRHGFAVQQWYRMNKATSFAEWKAAMAMLALPMMNTVYADRENIYYVYNALLPLRSEDFDWMSILPGNTSAAIWTDYLPYEALPQVLNPPSGLVFNTNSTPFQATVGAGNPDPNNFSPTLGIETLMNNRAIRSLELFGTDESITREEFLRYKFDRHYSKKSAMYKDVLNPLFDRYAAEDKHEKAALALLKNWDGEMDENSAAATLARLTYEPIHDIRMFKPVGTPVPEPEKTFKEAVHFLLRHYGRIDVPLGTIQRLRRGATDLPVGGGTDTLVAVHTRRVGDKVVGKAGDSYVLIAEFSEEGVESRAIHQYGNVNRKNSPHYDDQAPLFVRRQLRPSLLTPEAIGENLERSYHPGEELGR
ncbi:MAG: acylase [Desulfobacterales bacterium]|nr:acylase [Desulfobacterales bacterium]